MAIKNLGRVVGKNAYEVWLDQGNTGTEADFFASLKGDTPVKGEDYFTEEELKELQNYNNLDNKPIEYLNGTIDAPFYFTDLETGTYIANGFGMPYLEYGYGGEFDDSFFHVVRSETHVYIICLNTKTNCIHQYITPLDKSDFEEHTTILDYVGYEKEVLLTEDENISTTLYDNTSIQCSKPIKSLNLSFPNDMEPGYHAEIMFKFGDQMNILVNDNDCVYYGDDVVNGTPRLKVNKQYHFEFFYDVVGMKCIVNRLEFMNKNELTDNKVDTINENNEDTDYPTAKAVKTYVDSSVNSIVLPTKLSELENDSEFVDKSYVDSSIVDISNIERLIMDWGTYTLDLGTVDITDFVTPFTNGIRPELMAYESKTYNFSEEIVANRDMLIETLKQNYGDDFNENINLLIKLRITGVGPYNKKSMNICKLYTINSYVFNRNNQYVVFGDIIDYLPIELPNGLIVNCTMRLNIKSAGASNMYIAFGNTNYILGNNNHLVLDFSGSGAYSQVNKKYVDDSINSALSNIDTSTALEDKGLFVINWNNTTDELSDEYGIEIGNQIDAFYAANGYCPMLIVNFGSVVNETIREKTIIYQYVHTIAIGGSPILGTSSTKQHTFEQISNNSLHSSLTKLIVKGDINNDAFTCTSIEVTNSEKGSVLTTNNMIDYTPTEDYHPAHKKYVDDSLANVNVDLSNYYTKEEVDATIGDIDTILTQIVDSTLDAESKEY